MKIILWGGIIMFGVLGAEAQIFQGENDPLPASVCDVSSEDAAEDEAIPQRLTSMVLGAAILGFYRKRAEKK